MELAWTENRYWSIWKFQHTSGEIENNKESATTKEFINKVISDN